MNFHPFQGLQDLPDLPDAAHASREALVAEMLGLQAHPLPGPTPAVLRVSDRETPHEDPATQQLLTRRLGVARELLMRELVHRAGYMPASSITATHTGHPFGPEGYKTIAYELYQQLGGRVPAAVFVPTAYAELLYGVWLGFKDMQRVAGIGPLPQMIACEPAAGAPLRAALSAGRPVVKVDEAPTAAYSIVVGSNSYRGVLAVRESEGEALALTDEEITTAQMALGREGLWAEFSSAASLAGLRQAAARRMSFDGPVVCLMTSTGFKDQGIPAPELPPVAPTWEAVQGILQQVYGLTV